MPDVSALSGSFAIVVHLVGVEITQDLDDIAIVYSVVATDLMH